MALLACLRRFACLAVLAAGTALAAPAIPEIRELAVLEDPHGRESVESVSALASRFEPLPQGMLAAGYGRGARWVRLTVVAPPGEYWLDLMPPFLDDVRLFSPAPGHPGTFTERRSGDHLTFAAREMPYRGFVFRLLQPQDAPVTHYLRIESSSSILLVPRLHSPESFLAAVGTGYGVQFATLGAMLVVVLLNAVTWAWTRDALAMRFLAFLAAMAANVAGNLDIPAQYFFPESPAAANLWTMLASLLSIATGNLFYMGLFGLDRRQPLLRATYFAATALPLAAIPVALAGFYSEAMRALLPVVIGMNVVGALVATRQWRERRAGAGLVLVAVGVGFGGLVAYLLVLLGLYASHAVLLYGLQVTSLCSVLALHVALGARARTVHQERVRLDYLAHHDPLTQLPNRTLFFDRLGQAIARARRRRTRFALLVIDLDRFKPVNDRWGHPVGDLVLMEAARRMQDSVRASDTVGRIGGDEFVALLPDLDGPAAAERVARKLRGAVAAPMDIEGRAIAVDCSVGIAMYPDHGADEITLVNNADRAMYEAKARGAGSLRTCAPPGAPVLGD